MQKISENEDLFQIYWRLDAYLSLLKKTIGNEASQDELAVLVEGLESQIKKLEPLIEIKIREKIQIFEQRIKDLPEIIAPVEIPSPIKEEELRQYKTAKFKLAKGNYAGAREVFRKFLWTFPKSLVADTAQFWLAESYYKEGTYERAIVEYEKVVINYPRAGSVPTTLLKQAMAFHMLRDTEAARFLYQKVIKEYPKTPYFTKARDVLNRLKRGVSHNLP